MGFEACHPAVNLIYFVAVIYGALAFSHPVYLAIGYACAFAYSVWREGKRALVFNLALLPCIVAFALYYSSYHHFGVTVLRQNFIGNNMTLESLVYGFVLGVSIATVLMWFTCVYAVFSADKVVYLFGRVSPTASLFLAIILRTVPRLKVQAHRIQTARRGIGRGAGQGSAWARVKNAVRIFSMLISWLIGSLATVSDSMRSRGSALRGRTAFSIYRFDDRDRAYVIAMFTCLTLTAMAMLLGRSTTVYAPRILTAPFTALDAIFATGYFLLCTMPLMLDVYTALRFAKQ